MQNSPSYAIEPLVVTAHQHFVQRGFASHYPADYLLIAPLFLLSLFQRCCASHCRFPLNTNEWEAGQKLLAVLQPLHNQWLANYPGRAFAESTVKQLPLAQLCFGKGQM